MYNANAKKTHMSHLAPNVRIKNFNEVALGYSMHEAQSEASRCLNCRSKPCMQGCPVKVKIPEFISAIVAGDIEGAYAKIRETNSLPAICGRVCPQEHQCEQFCVRNKNGQSVAIGRLERFAADQFLTHDTVKPVVKNGTKIAIAGSGPAGLSCAGELASVGYEITVFEALHTLGGVLVYGIPEFRLPKTIVKAEIDKLQKLGVKFQLNTVIGKTLWLADLLKDYDCVFIGLGAGLPNFIGIDGENFNGVYSANEFLTRINLMKAYDFPDTDTPIHIGDEVIVVGGGNVAMDAARCAVRLGAENVRIIYRRSEQEMPARLEEQICAKEEGIIFETLTSPVKIIDQNGWVKQIECVKTELGQPDESGRARFLPKPNSNFTFDAQTVVIAIGQSPNPVIKSETFGLHVDNHGCITTDNNCMTNKKNVYAGGDIVSGAATVIAAMGAGKTAARSIHQYLSQTRPPIL